LPRRFPAFLLLLTASLLGIVPSPAAASEQEAWQAYQSGRLSLQREQYPEAEKQFRSAIGLDPLLSVAHYGLGQVLMVTRRYPEAIVAFEAARTAHRDALARGRRNAAQADQRRDAEIQELRDAIRQLQGGQIKNVSEHQITRLEQRIQELEREKGRALAAASEPPAEFSLALGSAHFHLGHLPEARQAYLDALKAQPALAEAHNNLAAVALQMGNKPEALEHLRAAEKAGFPVNRRMKAEIEGVPVPTADAAPPAAPAAPPVIHHQPLACVPVGTHPKVEARLETTGQIAKAKVKFRRVDSEFWYVVGMREAGDRFVASLPKPKAGLGAFRYFIDAVDQAAAGSRTEEFEVKVADGTTAECPAGATTVAGGLQVEVPPGAPSRPPVPEGFHGSGVKGSGGSDIGVFYLPPKLAAVIGVTTIAGGAAVAAHAIYDKPPAGPNNPAELVIVSATPPIGSTISVSRDTFTFRLQVTLRRDLGSGTLSLLFTRRGMIGPCVAFQGNHGRIRAENPEPLVLTGTLSTTFCRSGGEVEGAVLTLQENFETVGQPIVFEFPMPYTIVP
jgi:hypothetical protein